MTLMLTGVRAQLVEEGISSVGLQCAGPVPTKATFVDHEVAEQLGGGVSVEELFFDDVSGEALPCQDVHAARAGNSSGALGLASSTRSLVPWRSHAV